MKRAVYLIVFLYSVLGLKAQIVEPVHWTVEHQSATASYVVSATIDEGWHLYGSTAVDDGPFPTTFYLADDALPVAELTTPHIAYDNNFMLTLFTYEKEAKFAIADTLLSDLSELSVRYMACNDESCIPPTTFHFESAVSLSSFEPATISLPSDAPNADTDHSLLYIFLMGLLGGLLAIFTPCVWPIIPMTISFFIKRGKDAKPLRDALLYGLSIIIIYVGLGLLITVVFGASALNSIATNAVVNLLFFALIVVFALSFFGAFEITLPSSWSTRMNKRAASSTGFLSILFMAFTLVIVSFSCTGPIIGTLLVEAAGKSLLAPTIGMLGFAIALALPFSILALFPDLMKRLPRSGSWMDSLKITLAFLELALSLKFLSVADLAYGWHILDREVFVALWIVIFALLGLYLLGVFRFKHEEPRQGISVFRFMLAVVSLSFAMYMVPGLWGAPLKAISAFAPPMSTQDFVISTNNYMPDLNDLDEAMEKAKREHKQVLIDFSGYGCVNCRKMEAKVLSDERVAARLSDFVVVTLMVDDRQRLPEPIEVTENGKKITLKMVGERWSYVQRSRFGANAQPYYVRLTPQGEQIGSAYSYNEDIDKFLDWLKP